MARPEAIVSFVTSKEENISVSASCFRFVKDFPYREDVLKLLFKKISNCHFFCTHLLATQKNEKMKICN